MIRFIPLLFALLCSIRSAASPRLEFSARAQEIYSLTTSLRFAEARQKLEALRQNEPDNYTAFYLEHCADVLRVLAGDSRSDYQAFQKKMLPRLDKIARSDRKSPYFLFLQAEMHLHNAMLQARFQDYLAGASDMEKAYELLEENQRRFPEFIANKKSLGILHVILGSIPEEYRWAVQALSGMRGDVAMGQQELESVFVYARQHPDFVFAEESAVAYAVMTLYAGGDKEKAWQSIRSGNLDPRSNPLAAYVLAILANRSGRNNEAIRYLQESPSGGAYHPFPYRLFMLGLYKMYRLDTDADNYLAQFLAQCKGELGVPEALQKRAWYQLLQGNADGYRSYMERIKSYSGGRSDTDKAALREARSGEMPDPLLLKARLLFDGAYYRQARELLGGLAARYKGNHRLSLEYKYRLGRIEQESGTSDEAVRLFRLVIAEGRNDPWYFACNAAYQIGLLYEMRGDFGGARNSYEDCLRMHPQEYAASLHARAKAALNRIKNK